MCNLHSVLAANKRARRAFAQTWEALHQSSVPTTWLLPAQKLQVSGPSNGALGIGEQYSLAEHYLHTLTPVAERLLLGSTKGLENAQLLLDHRVSHAIILCCGPEVASPLGHPAPFTLVLAIELIHISHPITGSPICRGSFTCAMSWGRT